MTTVHVSTVQERREAAIRSATQELLNARSVREGLIESKAPQAEIRAALRKLREARARYNSLVGQPVR